LFPLHPSPIKRDAYLKGRMQRGVDRVPECETHPMLASHLLDTGRVEQKIIPPATIASTAIRARDLGLEFSGFSGRAGRRPELYA
jgi:hypothetical protein